jgi:hypothetical protein
VENIDNGPVETKISIAFLSPGSTNKQTKKLTKEFRGADS